MSQYVEYVTDSGDSVFFEVIAESGLVAASPEKLVGKAEQSLNEVLDIIPNVVGSVIDKLRKLDDSPTEASIDFGVDLGLKAGGVIAAGTANANFKITVKWTAGTSD